MLRVLLLLLLLPIEASAGAWLRDKGALFLSYSLTMEDPENSGAAVAFAALYAEFGLSHQITVGVDLGSNETGFYKAVAFAIVPLKFTTGAYNMNIEVGGGVIDNRVILRPGLSLGRGFELFGTSGWFSIDTRGELDITGDHNRWSTDVTIGFNTGRRRKMLLQLQQGGPMNDPDVLRLAPSLVFETQPGRHLEIGATAGVENAPDYGFKIGVWRAF